MLCWVSRRQAHILISSIPEHRLLVEAVKAGAAGYLLKGCHSDHLLDAVRRILRGEAHLDQELAIQVISDLADGHMQESAQASSVPPDKFRRQPLLSQPLTD
jgi:DNA-binding NarL/FixJ family response regulator